MQRSSLGLGLPSARRVLLLLAALVGFAFVFVSPAAAATIWSSTAAPQRAADPDRNSVEVGVKFRSDVDGYVSGVRFYKGTANTGAHVGNLWSAGGTNLARANFANETASGWQQVNFASPVQISANTTYVASYFAPVGRYAADDNYFATAGRDNPPLHALVNGGLDGPNGVYRYGSSTGFPSTGDKSTNYWVDVVFQQTAPPDTVPPTVISKSPAAGATGVAAGTNVTATFSEAMNAASITTSTITLRDPANSVVPAAVSYNASSRTATLDPTDPLRDATTYTATIKSGTNGVKDSAGNPLASDDSWSFTTTAAPGACPCSLWSNATVPGTASTADSNALEVGVRVRSDSAGYITGLRFYKGSGNTGTHVGKLWTDSGTLLSTATFSNESATGWQQVTLPNPVAVQANTTYVASYHTDTGFYASNNDYFATTGVDNAPLHAPQDGLQGANGVYRYGASGFPSSTYRSSNYWVDVVFDKTAQDTTAPTLTSRSPAPGSTSAPASSNVVATFSEPVQQSTISMTLTGPNGNVAGTMSYDAGSTTATFSPSAPLANQTSYTATVKDAKDQAGNTMSPNPVSWSFTTAAPPPPPPDQGPGGPVLLVTSSANPYTKYYAEILRNEGLNAFDTVDVSAFSAGSLSGHDLVVVGNAPLSAGQVSALTDFVNAGGSLIAMKPDAQLAGLLGITPPSGSLSDGYLAVNTAQEAAAGITPDTMQFHGAADRYTLNGATSVATLYSNATAATTNPAVTTREVGSNGGRATAFTYDLARSVVLTRQGNTAWAGQERDTFSPIRSDDQYFGGSLTDWANLSKAAIPQADEQQRLLANLVETTNRPQMPLPRFWYFPDAKKAVVIATGDDHAHGGTAGRFDQYSANSPAGCSVANWECKRFTSYIYPDTPLSNTQAQGYDGQGFEVALHPTTGCADYTPASLENDFSTQLSQWGQKYTSLPAPKTNRTHCIAWSDWSGTPQTEGAHGIRLDTTYYYWPGSWVNDRPGFMTGSGMPMRFANTDGSMVDVYQAATQMTDESQQSYPATPNALLDGALGTNGYYGAFTANMHTDSATTFEDDQLLASANARNVPIVSGRQMLSWLDGRNGSSFKNLAWNNGTLSFSIAIGAGARGLTAMLPTASSNGLLNSLTRDGNPVSYQTETIKGLEYAIFPAAGGAYSATYAAPAGAPTISALSVTDTTADSATLSLSTDRATTAVVSYGETAASLDATARSNGAAKKNAVELRGLKPATRYYYRLTTTDPLGNKTTSPAPNAAPASFVTAAAPAAPPAITNVRAEPLPDGTTSIFWDTDQLADGTVEFGPTAAALRNSRVEYGLARAHTVTLSHRRPGTTYFYRVLSRNPAGQLRPSAVQRFDTPAHGAADSRLAQWRMGDASGVTVDAADDGELRLPDGQRSGSFVSRLLDAEQMVEWRQATWNATVPAGTSVTVSVRTGSTKSPDSSWSDWYQLPDNGASLAGHVHDSRFLQYRVELTGTGQATPILRSIGFTSSGTQPQYPTEGGQTEE